MEQPNNPGRVGTLTRHVIDLLGLHADEAPIYLGETNIEHMKRRHPADYAQYGEFIPLILREPDFVGVNPKDDSIEYVREFCVGGVYVKVAVRVSAGGRYFVRSLYTVREARVMNFVAKGNLKPLDKSR